MNKEMISYQNNKVEYNIMATIVIFTLILSSVYYYFSNNIIFKDSLYCNVENVSNIIDYKFHTCSFKDDYDTYTISYPVFENDKNNRSFLNINKKFYDDRNMLLISDVKLKQTYGVKTDTFVNKNTVSFIINHMDYSYFYDFTSSFEPLTINRDNKILSNNQVVETSGYNIYNLNSKFKTYLINFYLEEFEYSYYSLEDKISYVNDIIDNMKYSKVNTFFIQNDKLTFIFNASNHIMQKPLYYKIFYDGTKFTHEKI